MKAVYKIRNHRKTRTHETALLKHPLKTVTVKYIKVVRAVTRKIISELKIK